LSAEWWALLPEKAAARSDVQIVPAAKADRSEWVLEKFPESISKNIPQNDPRPENPYTKPRNKVSCASRGKAKK
jgi:hypothetical protein